MQRQHCINFTDIAQEKAWANIEQKGKIVRNNAMVFRMFIVIIFVRTNGRKRRLDESDFHIVMVVFLKVPF